MPCSFWAASHRWWWAVKTWSLRGLNNRALWDNRVWLWGKWKFRPWPLKKRDWIQNVLLQCCIAVLLLCCIAALLDFVHCRFHQLWVNEPNGEGKDVKPATFSQIWTSVKFGILKNEMFAAQNMMNSFGSQSLRVSSWWHYFWHTCRNDRCWPTELTLRCLTLSDLVSLELRFDNVLNTLGMHKWVWNDMVWVKIPLVCLPKMNEHEI